VTIGRVEVRANLAPAAPPARRGRKERRPGSSLEDYLKDKIRRDR
jgi:hypothetical protein